MNEVLTAASKDWVSLNKVLHTLREDQVLELLNYEKIAERRINVLERLHQRYCKLRSARERKEILG